jgi:hypothetical protein
MEALTVSFLAGLGANLAGNMVTALGRRLRDAVSTPECEQAFGRCVDAGVTAMLLMGGAEWSDETKSHMEGLFTRFFGNEDVAGELAVILRGNAPDHDELAFLFEDAGYDPETLQGFSLREGLEAFEGAFLAAATAEPAFQGVLQTAELLKQTGIQQRTLDSTREMVAILREQPRDKIAIGPGGLYLNGNLAVTYNVNHVTVYEGGGAGSSTDRRVAALERAYLDYVCKSVGQLSLLGIDPKTAADPEAQIDLGAVYTALLTLTPEDRERMQDGGGLQHEVRADRHLSALAQLDKWDRLVILGDPGRGRNRAQNPPGVRCSLARRSRRAPSSTKSARSTSPSLTLSARTCCGSCPGASCPPLTVSRPVACSPPPAIPAFVPTAGIFPMNRFSVL